MDQLISGALATIYVKRNRFWDGVRVLGLELTAIHVGGEPRIVNQDYLQSDILFYTG